MPAGRFPQGSHGRTARAPEHGLRILIYHDNEALGGSEAALGVLIANLRPQHEITILGVSHQVVGWIAAHRPGVEGIVIRAVRNRRDVGGMIEHLRMIRRLRPEVFMVNLPMAWSGRYALIAGLLLPGVRELAVDHSPLPAYSRGILRYRRMAIRREAAHVAVSHALARHVEHVARLRPGWVRVIYNGVEDATPPSPRPMNDPPVLGVVARLSQEKGPDVFIRALANVPGVRGVIVGDGPDRGRLEKLAAALGVSERLTLMGWRDDVRSLLATFDLFVLPTRVEALGTAIVEAALAERPIIASSVGGVPEIVVHDETGLLVPPGDVEALSGAIHQKPDRRRAPGEAPGSARATACPEHVLADGDGACI